MRGNNDQELVTLDTELQFIRSYGHLLTTRYGSGFHLQVEVNKLYNNYLIPPLTLQLLIENAVKHNIVHKENPVLVTIYVSHGVWLANINAKFKLLNQQNITFEEVDKRFVVSIPLIKN